MTLPILCVPFLRPEIKGQEEHHRKVAFAEVVPVGLHLLTVVPLRAGLLAESQ
jgi:hypothetical protein